jgi:DnaK suppressor protein
MSLDNQQTEIFRARLIRMEQELMDLGHQEQGASDTVELDQSRQGRLSRMDALQGQAMSKELDRRRELELRAIRSALRRIDQGDYGYCIDCGEPISEKRLDYDPAAARCIACAERAERTSAGR